MKLVIALVLLAGLVLLLRLSVSWFGPSKPVHSGIDNETGGLLHPCPGTPNCFRTQLSSTATSVESQSNNSATNTAVIERLRIALIAENAKVETHTDNYLHATHKSAILGFTDDFECLVVTDDGKENTNHESATLHCRSASRIGRSDFGVNKKRVNAVLAKAGFKPPD